MQRALRSRHGSCKGLHSLQCLNALYSFFLPSLPDYFYEGIGNVALRMTDDHDWRFYDTDERWCFRNVDHL